MKPTATPPQPRSLFSSDGQQWSDEQPLDWLRASRAQPQSGAVTKLVLGTPPIGTDAKPITLAQPLPADFATQFPHLTHLHLWQLAGLKTLPALPPHLACLDVRGCPDLETLPPLPATLTTLDLGGCAKLNQLPAAPTALQRFFFNQCPALPARKLENFMEDLRAAPLIELDGSGTAAVVSLENFPASLQRLVLADCAQLANVSRVGDLTALRHLDLSGCAALRELPALPAGVADLRLHGADALKQFMGQDIGAYDRGLAAGQNVARIFHSRRKFGKELAASAHAKLLLLGDGRVGKSTLAKRLQWETLSPAEQAAPAHAGLRPTPHEDPTHKMRFWPWRAPLLLPPDARENLTQRATDAQIKLPSARPGELTGTVRIWDFGGQEIYHNTHRLFAGEGSVFLLVWREAAPDREAILRHCPKGCDPEEFWEYNRQRPLDYWLDYIFSLRADATVALVCTHCPPGHRPLPWTERAPRHAHRKLACFHLDSLDEQCGHHPEFQKLADWVKTECGREAERIGVLQPAFFGHVAAQVDAMLAENDAARQRSRPAPNLLLDWNAWRDRLIAGHKTNGTGQALDSDDVEAITTYLHGAGQIFRLQHGGETAILVDQEWATSLIYEMLRPGGRLYELIIANGGWLALGDLHEERDWKLLASDLQRERLLAYLEESHVLVRVPTDHAGGPEKTLFVANEKWLLPKDEAIAGRLEAVMQQVRARPAMDSWERFSFEAAKLNEFAFRDLMACLGRRFGANATWFRSGLQVAPNDQQPDRCLRVRWVPDGPDAFLGTVEAVLVTPHRDLSRDRDWLEKLFTDEKSPLAGHGQPVRRRADATDLTHEFICPLQPGQADVGISSSGEDHATAEALRTALRQAGIKVLWYKLPECRADEYEKLKPFMEKLGRSPCIVLLLSDTYLRDDPANNWYCLYELADAINRLADGRRSAARTLVLYQPGGNVSSQNLDVTIAPLFPKFAQCFADAYDRVPVEQWANFQRFNDLSLHFSTAYQTGSVARLFRERGTDGTFSSVAIKPDGTPDFTKLLADVRKALHGP